MSRHSAVRGGVAALASVVLIAFGGGNTASANNTSAAAQASQPANPVRTAFAEFDRVCGRAGTRETYVSAAAGAGWTAFEPAPNSSVGRLIAMGQTASRDAAQQMGLSEGLGFENDAFRKTVGGGELILLVSRVELPRQQQSLECRLYNLAATAPTPADIAAWTSTPPTARVNEQGLTGYEWEPGFRPGFSNIAVTHLDAVSPLRAQIPVIGLGITATQQGPAA